MTRLKTQRAGRVWAARVPGTGNRTIGLTGHQVGVGADTCGGVSYSDEGASSSTITFDDWRSNTAYGLYAAVSQRSCAGIGVESNPALAGGASSVSCQVCRPSHLLHEPG